MRGFIYICTLAVFNTLWSTPALAASFDCSKAATETEIAICNDDQLSALDERMSKAYKRARLSQDGEQYKNEQLKWLKERDLCFGDKQCLENAYNSILTKLNIFDYEALYSAALRNRVQCYQTAEEGLSSGFTHKMMGPSKELNTCIQNIVKHLIIATTSADATTIEEEFESLRGSHKFLTYHTFNTRKECSPSCGTMFELFPSAYYREVIENIMEAIFDANEMGHLWYNCSDIDCTTNSVSSSSETLTFLEGGWTFDKAAIHPACMAYEWLSGDNFEELADNFNIEDYSQFRKNPGLYLGGKINDYEPLETGWCSNDCIKVSLVNSLKACSKPFANNSEVSTVVSFEDLSYTVLAEDILNCNFMAPDLPYKIIDCHLVEISEETGGSMGSYSNIGIYGIAEFPSLGFSLFPLKFFENMGEALNFIDENNL